VKISLRNFSNQVDLDDALEFFKDKDTSKFAMPLEQSLDGIRADMRWLQVSSSSILEQIVNF
jgi:hypothetical protein